MGMVAKGCSTMVEPDPSDHVPAARYHPNEVLGLRLFHENDFSGAFSALALAARSAPLTQDGRDALEMLVGYYAHVSSAAALLDVVKDVLRSGTDALDLVERTRWQIRRLELIDTASPERRNAALDVLATATLADDAGWDLVSQPHVRQCIEAAFAEPEDELDLLELVALAPASSSYARSLPGRAYALGQSFVQHGALSSARAVERLLHHISEPELAYHVEGGRRAFMARQNIGRGAAQQSEEPHASLISGVLIAGGHRKVRVQANLELQELGVIVRDIPPAWEANRQGRNVRELVAWSDLVVLVIRQLAHSTSDQVRTAADRANVPIVHAGTPTSGAIRRAVELYTRNTRPPSHQLRSDTA